MASPTKKQLALLRKLAAEKSQTFSEPATSAEASQQIKLLLALQSDGYWSRGRTSRAGSKRTRTRPIR